MNDMSPNRDPLAFPFPPVRNLFTPFRHHTIVDIDLAGADAQVVAWTANDEDLKNAFRRREKIHVKNGIDIWGKERMYSVTPDGKSEPFYTRTKKGVHATNYGAKTAARRCGMTQKMWETFQKKWFQLHPPILEWHRRVDHDLQTTRTISNRFGYSFTFNDRPASCFNRALAWEPQSTVAEVTYIAMRRMKRMNLSVHRGKMQVHDSLVLHIPTRVLHPTLRSLHDMLHDIVIPFDDPLIIPWGLKMGAISWGQCRETKWSDII